MIEYVGTSFAHVADRGLGISTGEIPGQERCDGRSAGRAPKRSGHGFRVSKHFAAAEQVSGPEFQCSRRLLPAGNLLILTHPRTEGASRTGTWPEPGSEPAVAAAAPGAGER